ncbi:MAG TPA: hypothetical protein VGG11_04305 [Xanthobacteraceae bacterium]|jgi:hypothetical protein
MKPVKTVLIFALVGGYVLADEIARNPEDQTAAFARHEQRMRPFMLRNHATAGRLTRNPMRG